MINFASDKRFRLVVSVPKGLEGNTAVYIKGNSSGALFPKHPKTPPSTASVPNVITHSERKEIPDSAILLCESLDVP